MRPMMGASLAQAAAVVKPDSQAHDGPSSPTEGGLDDADP
jgi:hypothetical protein